MYNFVRRCIIFCAPKTNYLFTFITFLLKILFLELSNKKIHENFYRICYKNVTFEMVLQFANILVNIMVEYTIYVYALDNSV